MRNRRRKFFRLVWAPFGALFVEWAWWYVCRLNRRQPRMLLSEWDRRMLRGQR